MAVTDNNLPAARNRAKWYGPNRWKITAIFNLCFLFSAFPLYTSITVPAGEIARQQVELDYTTDAYE